MAMITIDDIKEYMSDVEDYGIQSYDDYFEKTRQDLFRRLRIDWYPSKRINQVSYIGNNIYTVMEEGKLDETQFTRTAVFYCLAYYIFPQLTKFNPEGDKFASMMSYYKNRYEEEWQMVLRDGVKYDDNDDGEFTSTEKQAVPVLRLVR